MNPWTAMLESLHSSLVDELNERLPELKLELGLPRRASSYEPPGSSYGRVMLCEIEFPASKGIAVLGVADGARARLGASEAELWAALLRRAGAEFSRRGIQPKLGAQTVLDASAPLPKTYPQPGRVIWIPFKVERDGILLGIGV